jgi:hypothetical protein
MRNMQAAGGRLGAAKHERKLPATDGLHGLEESGVLRSNAEEIAFDFDWEHLKAFKKRKPKFEELNYPEIQNPEACNDISCNIHGWITYCTRDIDHRLDGTDYQTQVKGTDFLFKMLEESLVSVSIHSPVAYQEARKKFKQLHKTLTDLVLREITNFFSLQLVNPETETIRQYLFRSFRSADHWEKIGLQVKKSPNAF